MKKQNKKVYIGSAVGIAAIAAVYCASTKYLVKLALEREAPKIPTNDPGKLSDEMAAAITYVDAAAKKLKEMPLEQVEIESFDGIRLIGHWYCPSSPKRIIVAMHGWRSTWAQDFGTIAPFWFENDCAVFFAEQRGQGNSDGKYMGFGLLEKYDCLDWIHWVNNRTESKYPVYLGGISMGATTVLMTGGLELPENVRGIAADCAFTSPHAIWKHVVEHNFHLPYGIYSGVAKALCKKIIQAKADESTVDALKNCRVPVLFVHGSDDHFVPIDMTFENYKACRSEKQLLIVPGAEHGMSYLVEPEKYKQTVLDFWKKFD